MNHHLKPGDRAIILAAPGVPTECVGRTVRIVDSSSWFVDAWETTRMSGWWRHISEWLPQINGYHWDASVLVRVDEDSEVESWNAAADIDALVAAHQRWVKAYYGRTE